MNTPLLSTEIMRDNDVVAVRQRARRAAELLGFDAQDQTRIATAVSELARNAFEYAAGGRAEFAFDSDSDPQMLVVTISDAGPGIADLDAILEGRHASGRGMGVGLAGARRLVDRFDIDTGPTGTRVTLAKALPKRRAWLGPIEVAEAAKTLLEETRGANPLATLSEQNRELVRSLDEIKARQEELAQLNRELEDTNRGVVALYAELDERAEALRQASELKSRFLSNMSHEFRTPLNSILALARLLLDRTDGELTTEQERQVGYIARSAQSLTDLVNDLLDLAKVEAGKVELRPVEFGMSDMFGGLRGALRPLLTREEVELIFEDPSPAFPLLWTDEAKVAQILRNLVSNALKFTERGEVRVLARHDPGSDRITVAVRDSGIGIAPEHHSHIFEEFAQVDSRIQRGVRGTGLGLPLSRRLAELLGGTIALESAPGHGSTFELRIPRHLGQVGGVEGDPVPSLRILVVDDDPTFRYVLRQMIGGDHEVTEAFDGSQALAAIRSAPPDVVLLDLEMPILDGYAVLDALSHDPATRDLPVVVVTSAVLGLAERRRLVDAAAVLAKDGLTKEIIGAALRDSTALREDRADGAR